MYNPIPFSIPFVDPEETIVRSRRFRKEMESRRSVRFFSNQPVPKETIEEIIKTAGLAPSGANKQPWTFCVISNQDLKSKIRQAAEEEERKSYEGRMSEEWLNDLAPLGTDWRKPFLEIAPWIIVVFRKAWESSSSGKKSNTYYSIESTGIACGMLITAIHQCGLVTLTHTPSPMNFLTTLLKRPENERPFLLLPIGYPASDAVVPGITKKNLEDISVWFP